MTKEQLSLAQKVRDLTEKVTQLTEENSRLRKHAETAFCVTCDHKCTRELITCALCKVIQNPAPELSPQGERLRRRKVFICSPFDTSTTESSKTSWAKTREYASLAFQDGYHPVAPQLYFPLFCDNNPEQNGLATSEGFEWLFEVAVEDGEFWICSNPSPEMTKVINIAESIGINIKYRYDHPKSVSTSQESFRVQPPKAEAIQPQTTHIPYPPPKNLKDKQWALAEINIAPTIGRVRYIEKWAMRNLPKSDIGEIKNAARIKIKGFKRAA